MTSQFTIRFVSRNSLKHKEAEAMLAPLNIYVSPVQRVVEELQTSDTKALVKDKCLKAFQYLGEPLFVEHTGLYLDQLNGLPGGLTQVFWDALEADRFSKMFGNSNQNKVTAKTVVGYVDGKRFWFFEGSVGGTIAELPKGLRDFQWDCVFIPDGYKETFAELGAKKNEISMRRIALDKFAKHLGTKHK